MRSTHPEDQRGPRPAWNGIGFGVVALIVVLFVLFAPAQRTVIEDDTPDPPTISLDDLEAMLSDSAGEPPATVNVETPDGPVTVLIPTTTTTTSTPRQPPQTTTSTTAAPTTTTTTSTTTTSTPRRPRSPQAVGADILDQLLPPGPPTTAEGGDGER